MSDKYYLKVGDAEQGPYPQSQVRSLLQAGAISLSTPCRKDGSGDWGPAGEMILHDSTGSTTNRSWSGLLLIMAGIAGTFYFAAFFDASIAAGEFGRVNNLGLANDRLIGVMISLTAFLAGTVLTAVAKKAGK